MINGVFFIGQQDIGKYVEHLATLSWQSEEERQAREKQIRERHKRKWYKRIKYKLACTVQSPAILTFMEKRGGKLEKIYLFLAYDVVSNGVWYYVKRAFNKVRK